MDREDDLLSQAGSGAGLDFDFFDSAYGGGAAFSRAGSPSAGARRRVRIALRSMPGRGREECDDVSGAARCVYYLYYTEIYFVCTVSGDGDRDAREETHLDQFGLQALAEQDIGGDFLLPT